MSVLHNLFEVQARQTPDAPAIVDGNRELTYEELDRRGERVAHFLRSRGVPSGGRVGISLDRSAELVVGLLGILKAGAAYVPLDPEYPRERLAFMAQDAQLDVLLTDEARLAQFSDLGVPAYGIESAEGCEEAAGPLGAPSSSSPACLLYTSGSTGQPKGAIIPHKAIVRLVINTDYIQLEASDRVAQVSNCSFDAATFEIWGALLNGASLVIVPREVTLSPDEMARYLREQAIGVMFLTTALFHEVARTVPNAFQPLRTLLFGGETANPRLVRKVLEAGGPARLLHVYGPTESTTFTTWYDVREVGEDAASVPIGRPIANTRVYILDRHHVPVPVGMPGELCIGGDGLADGYWRRPELTASQFVPDPFAGSSSGRMYKTGDRARYLPDGNIEFLGRLDGQVKLRGFRVELEEVERALGEHPEIDTVAAAVREDTDGDKVLAAFYVSAWDRDVPAPELIDFSRRKLPGFTAPRRFARLDTLPLTPNGKIDRNALPPLPEAERTRVFDPPRTEVERAIASVWEEVLHVERVGRGDNFFELGGHSLAVAKLMGGIRDRLGVRVPLQQIFETPVLADLAATMTAHETEERPVASGLRVPAGRPRPLSSAQEQLWFFDQLEPNSPVYNVHEVWRLSGRLDHSALEKALNQVVERHEILRTTYHTIDGEGAQIVSEAAELRLEIVDLEDRGPWADSDIVRSHVRELALRPFALAEDLMLRASLLRLGGDESVLVIVVHHIASDGWSLQILYGELKEFHDCFVEGREPSLAELPLQYADFAERQRTWLESPTFEEHVNHWKEMLAGNPPVLELPTDHTRPARQNYAGGVHEMAVPESLRRALQELGRRNGSTLFMVLLGVFKLLLSRLTGETDICIGGAIANRPEPELEALIGFFVNTLVYRTDLSGDPSFRELLTRVRASALATYTYQDMPFDRLVAELKPERSLSRNPLFDVMINFTNLPPGSLALRGVTVERLHVEDTLSHFGLTLHMIPGPEGVRLRVVYQRALFTPRRMQALLEQYCSLLEQVVEDPEKRISQYPVAALAEAGNVPALQLPKGRSEVDHIATESVNVPRDVSAATALAVFEALLYRYTGSGEFAVGVQDSDSVRPLVARLTGEMSFSELLASPQLPAAADQRVQVLFRSGDSTTSVESRKADLTLDAAEDSGGVRLSLHYNAAAVEASFARGMLGHFQVLLEAALETPSLPIWSLPLLTAGERQQVLREWNDTELPYPRQMTLHQLFEVQVERTPDAVAVVFEDRELRFAELNRAANRLAHHLRGLGVGPGELAGLCIERSPEMVVALLGILKAGGAYVPLESRYPAKRLAEMVEDAGLRVVVTREELLGSLPASIEHIVCLDRDRLVIEGCPAENPEPGAGPADLAYVIFTSGSTGRPKAVVIEHQSAVNYVTGVSHQLGLRGLAGFAMVQPLTVDSSVTAIYPPLFHGGCLHVISEARALDAAGMEEYFGKHAVDCLKIAPSHLGALHSAGGEVMPRRVLIVGGEPVRWDSIRRYQALAPDCAIYNHYGPTEATVGVTAFPVSGAGDPGAAGVVPIGRPLPNTTAYVLDANMQPVPVGVAGELYVGGDCLARGYLKQPEMTAAAFIHDPFGDRSDARLYRTGDRARLLADGNIEFLGRHDDQVKVRGFRIELGEVESVIARHPDVQDVAVTTDSSRSGDTRLIAYVVGKAERAVSEVALREFLAESVPSHLIPSGIRFADSLPRTPHGKLDRAALSMVTVSADGANTTTVAPRDVIETRLAGIWQEVLDVRPVGVRDNFFAIGGHSLLAITMFARIDEAFGKKLPLGALFEAPTIEHLAHILRREGWSPQWSSLVPIQPAGSKPPFFCVHAAQGNVLFYADLARHLGGDYPVYGLQSAGVDGSREPYNQVEEMAKAYIREMKQVQPAGPYLLAGFCSGAYVALEMAHQLQQRGESVPLLISFSTDGAWKNVDRFGAGAGYHWRNLSKLGSADKYDYLRTRMRYRGDRIKGAAIETACRLYRMLGRPLPDSLLARHVEEANRRATRLYRPHRYRGTLIYLQGSDETFRDPAPFWGDLVEELEVQRVPGSDMGIFREPHVRTLGERLRTYIDQAESAPQCISTSQVPRPGR